MSAARPDPRIGFDELLAFAQESLSDGASSSDEGGLAPRAFLARRDALTVLLIDPAAFALRALKAALMGRVLPALISEQRAETVAICFTMTTRSHKPPAELTESERALLAAKEIPSSWPPPERWPHREEQIVAVLAADRAEVWQAPVVRVHHQPPQLGYWGTIPGDHSPGVMFRPIRQALRRRSAPGQTRPERT